MADPFSITAGAAGLLSLALTMTEALVKYYDAYRNRGIELKEMTTKLEALLKDLKILEDVIEERKWRSDEKKIREAIEESISKSADAIQGLQEEVQKFEKEPTTSFGQTIRVAGRKAAYPFRKSTLMKLEEDVDDFQHNLNSVLLTLNVKDHNILRGDVEDIKKMIQIGQAETVAANVRDWLKAADASIEYTSATEKRHSQTGQWLVQGSIFRDWLVQGNSFLWLKGFAGCGKTVLCSTSIQHTFRHVQSQHEGALAYFFFTFRDDSKQDASAFLRSTLLQLCHQVPGVEGQLSRLKKIYPNGPPPAPVLLEHVRDAITKRQHVYLLFDALDEIPDDGKRKGVLDLIEKMRQWVLPGLHILVTSRDLFDIRQSLHATGDDAIELRNDSINEDISQYVSYVVEHDRRLVRWREHHERIKKDLSQKSGGVFRWVVCQFDTLYNCPKSTNHLELCLKSLPKTLDETYERMLCSIGEHSKQEARRILTFLCFSTRPLSVAQIIDAAAVDVESGCFDRDSRVEGADDLLLICPGLIEIYQIPLSDRKYRVAGSLSDSDWPFPTERDWKGLVSTENEFVRIAHFSVKEFLLCNRIGNGPAKEYALASAPGHQQISTACLIYLCDEKFCSQSLTDGPGLYTLYPFAQFAARHWPSHWLEGNTEMLSSFEKWSLKLFTQPDVFARWVAIYHHYYDSMPPGDSPPQGHKDSSIAYSMYFATLYGLEHVVRHLVFMKTDVNEKAGGYGTALTAAAAQGREDLVHILIDAGAIVDLQRSYGGNALHLASAAGHENVVRVLLNAGANINHTGGKKGSALQAASRYGHENVVRVLIDGGADVHQRGLHRGNALQLASEKGHENVVRVLINAGRKVRWSDPGDGAALQVAVRYNHENVVRALIDEGVNVNWSDLDGGSALQIACRHGRVNMVRALINAGANVNQNFSSSGSALKGASAYGDENLVRILLDAGADISIKDPSYPYGNAVDGALWNRHDDVAVILLTAEANMDGGISADRFGVVLGTASSSGCKKVVQILLESLNGLKTISQGDVYERPLGDASQQGGLGAVQVLLNAASDFNPPTDVFDKALQGACSGAHKDIVRLLLDAGTDPAVPVRQYDSHIPYSRTPLEAASETGDCELVKMLLDAGADLRTRGDRDSYMTALNAASKSGSEELVRLLLDAGADVNLLSVYERCRSGWLHGTALEAASAFGHCEVAKVLLTAGADVEGRPIAGQKAAPGDRSTPLIAASKKGSEEVVRLLLDTGADVDLLGEYTVNNTNYILYRTALEAASAFGHYEVAKVLLAAGADVEGRPIAGPRVALGDRSTPLVAASKGGSEELVRLLLDAGADVNLFVRISISIRQYYGSRGVDGSEFEYRERVWRPLQAVYLFGTPLEAASMDGHDRVVRVLLEAGADINGGAEASRGAAQGKRRTPLIAASAYGRATVVRILLDSGADVHAQGEYEDEDLSGTALNVALYFNRFREVKMLLDAGADQSSVSEDLTLRLRQFQISEEESRKSEEESRKRGPW